MSDRYKLVGSEPIQVEDLLEWANWFEEADRQVAHDKVNGHTVSTVFLGLDHGFGQGGPPVLFETMIFPEVGYQERSCTWDEALECHKVAVKYAEDLMQI